ncbi:hypothetical protein IIA28_14605 [candidate division KSB1 bacterium]|nr:hypothetical protein [candidate division KSB1 bacterium]
MFRNFIDIMKIGVYGLLAHYIGSPDRSGTNFAGRFSKCLARLLAASNLSALLVWQ